MAKNLGVGGGLGALLGLFLIWWLEPSNAGGIGLLLFIPTVICTTIGGILSLFCKKKVCKKNKEPGDKEDKSTSKEKNQDDNS
jgi:hypothetical protein